MAYIGHGLHSYGLCSYDLHSYGLQSYGLHSYAMACIAMACIAMACIVMARIVVVCIVFLEPESQTRLAPAGCVERGAASIVESRHALRQFASHHHLAVHTPTWFARSRSAP